MLNYRLMTPEDCESVADLLQQNAESQQGGLLGEYPLAKVEAMFSHSLRVVIVEKGDTLVGVVFSFSPRSASVSPVTQKIAIEFSALLKDNWFYGPACIDAHYRGQGILKSLYESLSKQNLGKPIAFINRDNTRSIRAHNKCGMQDVAQFTCDGTDYLLMMGNSVATHGER